MSVYVFKRDEKKYLVTEETKKIIEARFSPYICPDKYGQYTLCNIYYDTDKFDLIRMSVEKPDFKEKLRLRTYSVPNENTPAYIELKRKFDGTVYKRRVEMPFSEAQEYLKGCRGVNGDHISEEIAYFCSVYDISPKMLIAYERTAYCGKEDKNLRVTFDRDIRYSLNTSAGFECSRAFQRLLEEGVYVMEIKANGAVPVDMARILSNMKVYPNSFSKYGKAYIKEMQKGRI